MGCYPGTGKMDEVGTFEKDQSYSLNGAGFCRWIYQDGTKNPPASRTTVAATVSTVFTCCCGVT